jgi:hypothetical protein
MGGNGAQRSALPLQLYSEHEAQAALLAGGVAGRVCIFLSWLAAYAPSAWLVEQTKAARLSGFDVVNQGCSYLSQKLTPLLA